MASDDSKKIVDELKEDNCPDSSEDICVEIAAEAIAEQTRRHAKGEADAIFAKMQAEGKGIYEILSKQAAGFSQIVDAANNNPTEAVRLMIADKLPELVKAQVEAIKSLKIDKITVWDSMSGGKDGKSPTSANFLIKGNARFL